MILRIWWKNELDFVYVQFRLTPGLGPCRFCSNLIWLYNLMPTFDHSWLLVKYLNSFLAAMSRVNNSFLLFLFRSLASLVQFLIFYRYNTSGALEHRTAQPHTQP